MRNLTLRPTLLAVVAFFCSHRWGETGSSLATASQVNITVDDTDPSILYEPSNSWHASSVPCSTCLNPSSSIAFMGSWHDGTHIIPTTDNDDFPSSSSQTPHQTSTAPSSTAPSPTGSPNLASDPDDHGNDPDDHPGNGGDPDSGDGKGNGGKQRRRLKRDSTNPFETQNTDSDDPGFVDIPVTAQFNFTGSAVYLYCILPLGTAPANSTPTYMNLTYTLDGQPAGSFVHNGSSSASGFLPRVNTFALEGFTEGPHSLQIHVGPDSVFLFDYAIYTQSQMNASQTVTSSGSQLTSNPSPDTTEAAKHHNVATFGGAVGGSFGVLTVLSFGIAISIYRRRLLAKRRDRRFREQESDRESLHTDASEDGPPMQGPAPFVPRYFPGTVPTAPPPYVPRASTSSSRSPSFTPSASSTAPYTTLRPSDGDPLSYADRPPPTPPPLLDALPTDEGLIPPPPFGAALAAPVPQVVALPPPGIPPPSDTAPSSPPPTGRRSRPASITRSIPPLDDLEEEEDLSIR